MQVNSDYAKDAKETMDKVIHDFGHLGYTPKTTVNELRNKRYVNIDQEIGRLFKSLAIRVLNAEMERIDNAVIFGEEYETQKSMDTFFHLHNTMYQLVQNIQEFDEDIDFQLYPLSHIDLFLERNGYVL